MIVLVFFLKQMLLCDRGGVALTLEADPAVIYKYFLNTKKRDMSGVRMKCSYLWSFYQLLHCAHMCKWSPEDCVKLKPRLCLFQQMATDL